LENKFNFFCWFFFSTYFFCHVCIVYLTISIFFSLFELKCDIYYSLKVSWKLNPNPFKIGKCDEIFLFDYPSFYQNPFHFICYSLFRRSSILYFLSFLRWSARLEELCILR
jgi:hypothetical protein